jgi:hypothetical protein
MMPQWLTNPRAHSMMAGVQKKYGNSMSLGHVGDGVHNVRLNYKLIFTPNFNF